MCTGPFHNVTGGAIRLPAIVRSTVFDSMAVILQTYRSLVSGQTVEIATPDLLTS
jgi:hypothetical protein